MAEWLKDCEICNQGLCSEMNKIMGKHGLSERSAADVLADVVQNQLGHALYTAKQLRNRYRYHTNKDKKKVAEIPPAKKSKDGSSMPRANPKPAAPAPEAENQSMIPTEYVEAHNLLFPLREVLLDLTGEEKITVGLRLKNAAAGFNRTVDDYPGEPASAEDEYNWAAYFLCAEVRILLHKLQQKFYQTFPEELPEHRAKRGRPKKDKSDPDFVGLAQKAEAVLEKSKAPEVLRNRFGGQP